MSFQHPTQREVHMQGEYTKLCHAVQSGVKFDQESGSECGSPKHLRTGVNIAMVQHSAIAGLLESKGLITAEEYWESVIHFMKIEIARYESLLSVKLKGPVKIA